MSYVLAPFEVSCKALSSPLKCRFIHLMPGIATRHSDTIDVFFLVDGGKVTVAVSCATLSELREQEHRYLSDQQIVEIAGLDLRRTLEQGYDPTQAELFLGGDRLRARAQELGYF